MCFQEDEYISTTITISEKNIKPNKYQFSKTLILTCYVHCGLVMEVGHCGHSAHVHVTIILFLRSESQLTRAHFGIMVTIFCAVSHTISDGAAISCPSQRHGRVTTAAGFTRQRDVSVQLHIVTG